MRPEISGRLRCRGGWRAGRRAADEIEGAEGFPDLFVAGVTVAPRCQRLRCSVAAESVRMRPLMGDALDRCHGRFESDR